MADILDRLKAALADRYQIERELGSGGMATVYLAEDLKLHRKVALKVLRPDLAAALGPDRFLREIEVAAQLHHPHILPLFDSGEADGFLYYVMPYEKGQSLRDRLAKEGELPIPDAVRILRDVVDALAHAHENGVVHRDVKPDNVLLSERHALVTDFGVAKAVSEATGTHQLTTEGVALGTPAYMSPEQAAADKRIDHRADIYAVGALGYELLTGRPPFVGTTPQEVLAAHVTQPADPVTKHRETVPPGLAQLVMRCLEKKPADRWQSAEELLPQLEALTTPSGGTTPTGVQPVPAEDYEAAARRAHPVRVAALFGLGAVGLLAVVFGLVIVLGLPDWVFMAAVALVVLALPITLLTGHHERQRALARITGTTAATPATGLRRWFRWRKALVAGATALTVLATVTAAYMAMRLVGIGAAGTLVSSGALDRGETVILADFTERTGDSLLATTLTEAFRVDLGQSRAVSLMSSQRLRDALGRMQRDPDAPFPTDVAQEVAVREGVKAIVAGEINRAGAGYVLTAQVLAADNGNVLEAIRETASDSTEIIPAIDRLSKRLRGRIGESLRSTRAAPRLSSATTASLPALRLYSQASRARTRGDYYRAIELLKQATTIDTTFAEAYRMLAIELGNAEIERRAEVEALSRAFRYRHKLPDDRRYYVEGSYYSGVANEPRRAIQAYSAQVEIDSSASGALNNIGVEYFRMRDFERADEFYQRAMAVDSTYPLYYQNRIAAQINLGRLDSAEALVDRLAQFAPDHAFVPLFRSNLAMQRRDLASALSELDGLSTTSDLLWGMFSIRARGYVAAGRGSVAAAERYFAEEVEARASAGLPAEAIEAAVAAGDLEFALSGSRDRAVDHVLAALERFPLDSIDTLDRPYLPLALFFARAGDLDRSRELVAEFEASVPGELRTPDLVRLNEHVLGVLELQVGRPEQALEHLHRADLGPCMVCVLPALVRAHDATGNRDSAIAIGERYTTTPDVYRFLVDWLELAPAHKRLGELYEQSGDVARAIEHYNEFVELWKDADPELQPQVEDVRQRIARLVGEPQQQNRPD